MTKGIYKCNNCEYESNRPHNLSRHLDRVHKINAGTDSDMFFDFCTFYESEHECMMALAKKSDFPAAMSLDLQPYIDGDVEHLLSDPAILDKLASLEGYMTTGKVERLISEFYRGQMTYNGGKLKHFKGETFLSDDEYYNLWYVLIMAHLASLTAGLVGRSNSHTWMRVTNTSCKIAQGMTSKTKVVKRLKPYISEAF